MVNNDFFTKTVNLKLWALQVFLLGMVLSFLSGCSKQNPTDLRLWYSENYPSYSLLEAEPNKAKASGENSPSKEADQQLSEEKAGYLVDEENRPKKQETLNSEFAESEYIVEGHLNAPVDLKYASAVKSDNDYGAASMIESKLFKLVEDAFNRRDQVEFVKLYDFFLESFPHSNRKVFLGEKWRNFFYSESLEIDLLSDALVEITYPTAKTLEDFNHYLAKLKSNGIGAIQIPVVQHLGTPIYLFSKPEKHQGYYFVSSMTPLVDNILDKITSLAHKNGLKLLVSLPLRHHPLIGDNPEYIMDESWNVFQNRTTPNSKLDLLNPHSKTFLQKLIKALLSSEIDGIVFKDDFIYEINEGFSPVAQNRYLAETGRKILFNRMFIPVKPGKDQQYDLLTNEEFEDVALWRTREVKQFLWDIVTIIRRTKKKILIGIEVTPEMLLDQQSSVKWYSTGLHYLKDLDVDLFILKWRRYNSMAESDLDSFKRAAHDLRRSIAPETKIYLKIPLSQDTQNIIRLNKRIKQHAQLLQEISASKIAIGPVSRLDNLDFMN